jgi:hypothetical protein
MTILMDLKQTGFEHGCKWGGGGVMPGMSPSPRILEQIDIDVRKYKYQKLKVLLKLSLYPEYSREISKIALKGFDVSL